MTDFNLYGDEKIPPSLQWYCNSDKKFKKKCAYCGKEFYIISCTFDEYCYKIDKKKYFCRYQHLINYEKYGGITQSELISNDKRND